MLPRSSVPGIEWPALPDARTAGLLALLWQLEDSEWWSTEELAERQMVQLRALVAHAIASVPHYEGLRGWADVPILTRAALIAAGPKLLSRAYPSTHGPVDEVMTSRTTGEPVRVKGTGVIANFWQAISLRDHRWHDRDLGAHLATIRYTGDDAPPPDGLRTRGWSPLAPDAPLSVLSVKSTTEQQIAWLEREDPEALLVYPSVLDALLRRGLRLPRLREVRTIGEVLPDGIRARCPVPIVDAYSAQEVGYIALQCPSHQHYHVQSERVLVEILDEQGLPCHPGETGRVVITDLHNFATPILRYEIGDLAQLGAPCPCGRGLPVLTRIVGRRRNMLTYPDGRTMWPVFTIALGRAARYREVQLVQVSREALRLRVVPDGPVDRAALTAALHGCFDHPFDVEIEEVAELSRGPTGKLEEFVSLL